MDEPEENISGGAAGGGAAARFEPGAADTSAEAVVDRLGERYWTKTYGGQDAFECLVRTVLSQNTSDKASQPAHDALMETYGPREARSASERSSGEREVRGDRAPGDGRAGDAREQGDPRDEADLAEHLAVAEESDLADTIRPAGLYNQKAETLIRLADRVCDEYGGTAGFDEFVRSGDPGDVRDALLEMDGVGPKTADCVLLFAGGSTGVFPVDTHVHRIYRRLGIAPPDADHGTVRGILERDVPPEKCGFGHTATIQFGREYCTARKPACLDGPEACPLFDRCDRVGVDVDSGAVVDPAEVSSEE